MSEMDTNFHRHRETFFVGGEWRESVAADRISVISPFSERVIGSVPDAREEDMAQAVAAARASFDDGSWRSLAMTDRAGIVERAIDDLAQQLPQIADLVTAEIGMPIAFCGPTVSAALDEARYLIDLAKSGTIEEMRGAAALVVREPMGVVASIAPWNAPFNFAVSKIVAPLLAGCSVVFKPAPETPLDAYYLVQSLADAGVLKGTVNLVTGGRDAGRWLVDDDRVDMVSFTGSTATGQEIGAVCGRRITRTQLELGGKSAAIVLDDFDEESLMTGIAIGSFLNSGQVCAAYSRILVPRERYEEIASLVTKVAASFVIGDPTDPATTLGPLVSERHRARVENYISTGLKEGATALIGGKRPSGLPTGWFIEPTVFGDVENSMVIAREEIFGPVVAIVPHDGCEDAIRIANDSMYGLHAGVFTRDETTAAEVARSLRTGSVSVNGFTYDTETPFGGFKSSGIGRSGGPEGLAAFSELKTVHLPPRGDQRD